MAPSTRPQRAAAAGPSNLDADSDYQELSDRQRQAIDRAFERGAAGPSSRSAKQRKLADAQTSAVVGPGDADQDEGGEGAGGFMPDDTAEDGGFLPDDGEGGGFLPDDEDEGGFLPDDREDGPSRDLKQLATGSQAKVPLHRLPQLLAALGLPSDDDVLAVFRSSASGWDDSDEDQLRRSRKGQEEELGVGLKDFRAVCAALMGPDEGVDLNVDEIDLPGGGFELESEDEEPGSDVFQPSDAEAEESDLSSLSGSDYKGDSGKRKRPSGGGKGKGAPRKTKNKGKNKGLEEDAVIRLSARQRDMAKEIWDMLRPPAEGGGRSRGSSGHVLGREEVKKWVRTMGEMWTEDEITDMVALFSTQHEQRGLSFDDFGKVMLRAGLV